MKNKSAQRSVDSGFGLIQLVLIFASLIFIVGLGIFLMQKTSTKTGNNPIQSPVSFLNNAPDKTEDTYTSNILGIEFKYPLSLSVKEDSEEEFNKRGNGDFRKNFSGYVEYQPGKFSAAVVVLNKDNSYDMSPLTLWIFDNPDNLTIDAWYKKYWYYPFVWGDFTQKGKVELAPKLESTISGQLSKSGVIDYQPGKPKFIFISKDNKIYLFRLIDDNDKNGEKILSSFKFSETTN